MSAHAVNRRQYWVIFVVLGVLTALEVGVAYIHEHRQVVFATLVALAITKAAFVALFYMHLSWETKVLKWMVAIPLALPALYAVVLITEAVWRRLA